MPTYQCGTCQRVEQFVERYEYLLKEKKCTQCGKLGTFKSYDGEMHPTILDREDEKALRLRKELGEALKELDAANAELEKTEKEKETTKQKFERLANATTQDIATNKDAIEKLNAAMIKWSEKIDELKRKASKLGEQLDDLGSRQAVRKDAPVAYNASKNVQQDSQKNKLYIGSRQYVSKYAATGLKKKRILDVPNWSPGLNVSWVEGGISAKAHFKIKIDPANKYHTIPEVLLTKFKETPGMDPEDFLKLCKTDGKDSLLWYDKDGKSRPTWTAMEIWCLLRAGYQFTFADSKKEGAGRKIVLVPPA